MIKAVSIALDQGQMESLAIERGVKVPSTLNGSGDWYDVEYLILCSYHSPSMVAKIKEIVIPQKKGVGRFARFLELRSLVMKNTEDGYHAAFNDYKYRGVGAELFEFENDDFFRVGDPVPLTVVEGERGSLTLSRAIRELARTYSVDRSQVEIIIRSKLDTSASDDSSR
ncbi:hypothetical protein P5705_05130 [Pseudomonas entomophila]|uniref:hypothetical protein n=1 Tax=Pseudomonas entomophila TaxID=312306 RepID=UPI002405701C|nr:hypothetical protein [Pseudomonas entomophila]MDF9617016.1 hypothetical protein [Pseudomonas entomophila]